jgi:signal transduction histidine kinase
MGLSLACRAVQMHGGHIRVDSRPGEGTRVVITLPPSLIPALETVS